MAIYKTLAKNEDGQYRIIEQESKNKKEFIKNLRGNGFKVTEIKVKTKDLFDRAFNLIDYVSSKEEAQTIWKNIKYTDDTIESIFNRAFQF